METVSLRIRDVDKKYLEDLAVALDRYDSYLLRKMVEYAIQAHKDGKLEI